MMEEIKLSELNFDNLGQWPLPFKIGVIALVFFLIFIGGYWFVVKPNFEIHVKLQKQEKELRSDFELKQKQAASLHLYRNQLKVMQEKFGAMLRKLPAKQEMPGLLEDISRTGIASGLKFELFAPQEEIQHDFYVELPIKIRVVGNYHQIAIFLSRVAEMSRIVTMHDFVIGYESSNNRASRTQTKRGGQPVRQGSELIMDITANIYRYRSQ